MLGLLNQVTGGKRTWQMHSALFGPYSGAIATELVKKQLPMYFRSKVNIHIPHYLCICVQARPQSLEKERSGNVSIL